MTMSKFNRTDVLTFVVIRHHVTFKLRCYIFGKLILPLTRSPRQSLMGLIFVHAFSAKDQ